MRLEKAREDFIKHLGSIRRSEDTIRAYASDVKSFIDHVIHEEGRDSLAHFTPAMVESWLAHLVERGLSASSMSRHQTGIQAFARWGRKRRYWAEDPTVDLERIQRPRTLPRPFTQDERNALMALTLDETGRALRALLYYTGLRSSEICRLQIRDITRPGVHADGTPKLAVVRVRHGKGGKDRLLDLSPACWAAVEDLGLKLTDNSPRAFLFAYAAPIPPRRRQGETTPTVYREGRPWRREALERRVREWGVRAGVADCTPHRWRHAQPLSSPVLTPEGWTTMGALKISGQVIGSDGKPTEVIGIFPQGTQPVFRLLFSDGASVECTLDHLWPARRPLSKQWPRTGLFGLCSTQEILDSRSKWVLPVVAPIVFGESVPLLPIDPYTLGALLGDGCFDAQLILATTEPEILARVANALPAGYGLRGSCGRYTLATLGTKRHNVLLRAAKSLGLTGLRSHEKTIPDLYLRASVADRYELLRGLMDTDGCAPVHGGSAEFATTSPALSDGLVKLVRSLGGTARVRTALPYKTAKRMIHRIAVRTAESPFHLCRKHRRYTSRRAMPFLRTIIAAESAGRQDCMCIQIANPDGLYVTKDYVLTHNTFATDALAATHDLRAVQEALGHSSVATTQIYTQIVDRRRSALALSLPTFPEADRRPADTRQDYAAHPPMSGHPTENHTE